MSLLLLMGDSGFNPATLFSNGEQGAWYDPSDFSTMYTDSAGTTPVTAVGDLVGRINDKSGRGNNAIQATSGNRPSLARVPFGGRRNLLNWSEDLSNATWTKTNVTAASATNLTYNGLSTPAAAFLQQLVTIAGGTASKSFTLRVVLSGTGKLRIRNTHSAVLDTVSSDITLTSTPTAYTLTVTNGASAGNGLQNFGILPASDNATFNVTISQFQAEQSLTATNYQKVTTAGTVADVTESGQRDCYYLDFASNKSLATSAIDFSATDEMTVIAGVRKVSDAADGMACELSANAGGNAGSFYLGAPEATASASYTFLSRGSASVSPSNRAEATGFAAPVTNVVTGQSDISNDAVSIRVNGSLINSDTGDQGTGNYGNYALNVGARNGSSVYFTGHIYQLIIRGRTTPDSVLRQAERHVATRTGVTI
jgi:hypothetical protein